MNPCPQSGHLLALGRIANNLPSFPEVFSFHGSSVASLTASTLHSQKIRKRPESLGSIKRQSHEDLSLALVPPSPFSRSGSYAEPPPHGIISNTSSRGAGTIAGGPTATSPTRRQSGSATSSEFSISSLRRRMREVEEAYNRSKQQRRAMAVPTVVASRSSGGDLRSLSTRTGSQKLASTSSYSINGTKTSSNTTTNPHRTSKKSLHEATSPPPSPSKSVSLKQSIVDRLTLRSRSSDRSRASPLTIDTGRSVTSEENTGGSAAHSTTTPSRHLPVLLPTPPTSAPPARADQIASFQLHGHGTRRRASTLDRSGGGAAAAVRTSPTGREPHAPALGSPGGGGGFNPGHARMGGHKFADGGSRRGSSHDALAAPPTVQSDLDWLLSNPLPEPNVKKYALRRETKPRGLVGIANVGNTCFMNSILQCMFSADLLVGYFLSPDFPKDINPKSPTKGLLAQSFGDMVKRYMKPGTGSVITPTEFKEQLEDWAPQFVGYEYVLLEQETFSFVFVSGQQDAQEFLRFILDGLHEDLNRCRGERRRFTLKDSEVDLLSDAQKSHVAWNLTQTTHPSPILSLFAGQLRSTVTCLTCHNRSSTFETFWDLSLPIPSSARTLEECISGFGDEEVLDTAWRCGTCRTERKASKMLRVERVPEVLVLHLKRFTYTPHPTKLLTSVRLPPTSLSLSSISTPTAPAAKYTLFAVSNHMGGLDGGHYVAHVKNVDDRRWYRKNDRRVEACEEGVAGCGETAYVVFYEKEREKETGTGTEQGRAKM
ncbi:Ubiquitin carboxyl-terminal hydrolase 21 [Thoreauomyces humboldtii]|nr:Ubiquitin carboxyl-terminal hydrolase 21 [Thoreauomyces humboldtii]